MIMSQIVKSVNFTKTQKPRYLVSKTFFLQIKKFINYTSWATLMQQQQQQQQKIVAELPFKV